VKNKISVICICVAFDGTVVETAQSALSAAAPATSKNLPQLFAALGGGLMMACPVGQVQP
jgi:hypothetical protein